MRYLAGARLVPRIARSRSRYRTPFMPLPSLLLALAIPAQDRCDPRDGGLTLAPGFCAVVVAEDAGQVRQLTVGPDGDLYAAVADGEEGVLALRDQDGDGAAETRSRFGPADANDVELRGEHLYLALRDRIIRWRLAPGRLVPEGGHDTIVSGLPAEGNHQAKSIAFGRDGVLFVAVGSATNSCQRTDRQAGSPGRDPCRELERHAGIWVFDAERPNQRFDDGRRYATGLRNALALAVEPATGALYAAVHGRDQLGDNWGFSDEVNATEPAEELVRVTEGDDFGWPYCYYSYEYRKKVLAPEYGGDGRKVGRCAGAKEPAAAFPAHWAPLALAFHPGGRFGAPYAGGLFVAFHGSWNRAPLPQAGYRVSFLPFGDGRPAGPLQSFAAGRTPTELRASGVAVGPDGALYISADQNGKIWKVIRK